MNALCADGVTTRSEVTTLSGRGVGMAAFKQRVLALGGSLEVRTVRGEGTTWLVRFPASSGPAPRLEPLAAVSRRS